MPSHRRRTYPVPADAPQQRPVKNALPFPALIHSFMLHLNTAIQYVLSITFAKAFYDPGFNSIDGFIVKRDKNDYVLIIKDNRKPGYSDLFCVSGPSAEGPYTSPSTKFAPTYSEGPCAVKVGDEWLIYFDVYREGRFGAVATKDFKTFTPIDNQISIPQGHKHGTIIKVPESVLLNLKAEEAKRFPQKD